MRFPSQDLIDPTCTPSYKLKPCQDDKEFKILTITAGPPYEDIAFKVRCMKVKTKLQERKIFVTKSDNHPLISW